MIAHLLIGILLGQADRPSADEVREAVATSRETWTTKHPESTKEGRIARLEREIALAEASRKSIVRLKTRGERKKAAEKIRENIESLNKQIDAARSEKESPSPLAVLKVGDRVGRIMSGTVGNTYFSITCLQILGPNEAIISQESETSRFTANSRTVTSTGERTYILKANTSAFAEGHQIPLEKGVDSLNVVIVGQKTYPTADGSTKTVHVLEVFDPDKEFK